MARARITNVRADTGGAILTLSRGAALIVNCTRKEAGYLYIALEPETDDADAKKYEWIDIKPDGLYHDGELFASTYGPRVYTYVREPKGFRSKREG